MAENEADLRGVDLVEAAASTDEERRNVQTVLDVFASASRGDFTFLKKHLAPGGDVWWVANDDVRFTKGQSGFGSIFPTGVTFVFKRAAVNGRVVLVEWDDEADTVMGDRYENHGVCVFEFDEDGRVLAYREYFDPRPLFAAFDASMEARDQ